MDLEYRKHYRELYQKHWWWRARTEWIVDALRRLRPAKGWSTILDVGCGEGLFFERLSEFGEAEGIELEEALQSASVWRDRIYVCPFDESFQPGKRYSLILMLDVLEHLPSPGATLSNVRRLLAPEGLFLATVPALQVLWTNHDVINHHFRRYTKGSFRPLAEYAGLQVFEESYFFQWTCAAKLLVSGVELAFRPPPKIPTVPPSWINETLYLFSRIEQRTLGRLPMPFGSSLMVVARQSSPIP